MPHCRGRSRSCATATANELNLSGVETPVETMACPSEDEFDKEFYEDDSKSQDSKSDGDGASPPPLSVSHPIKKMLPEGGKVPPLEDMRELYDAFEHVNAEEAQALAHEEDHPEGADGAPRPAARGRATADGRC